MLQSTHINKGMTMVKQMNPLANINLKDAK